MTDLPYRVIVTGSRDWTDEQAVWLALAEATCKLPADREIVIVHGGCPTGADAIAHAWGSKFGTTIDIFIADWANQGKAAGPRRNVRMVGEGADICLAFIKSGSRGATHTATLADRAGVPVRRWTA